MTDAQQIERVTAAYKRAMEMVMNDLKFLPEGAVAITPLILGLVDRMLPPDPLAYMNMTATGAEIFSRLRSEQ